MMQQDLNGRGFFDLSFFAPNGQNLNPNFYDFDFVSNIMEQFINSTSAAKPVTMKIFERETIPLQIKHKPKNEEFNCSICIEILACEVSEIDKMSKADIKLLKVKFDVSDPD